MAEFFEMGGYAAYVWPAYGASFFILSAISAHIWLRKRDLTKRLNLLENQKDTDNPS